MGLGEELWAISGKNIEKAKADLKVLASVVVIQAPQVPLRG